jgi:hypothetical protein
VCSSDLESLGKDPASIKKALDELQKEVYEMSSKLYKGQEQPPQSEGGSKEEGKTIDADFKVDEDKK